MNNRKPQGRAEVQLIDASYSRFWKAMRKSLGSKRREIPEDARHHIVRLYEAMGDAESDLSEFSKIFATTDFGYREIRVERPLRLRFQATSERIAALAGDKTILKLSVVELEILLAALAKLPADSFDNRDDWSWRRSSGGPGSTNWLDQKGNSGRALRTR